MKDTCKQTSQHRRAPRVELICTGGDQPKSRIRIFQQLFPYSYGIHNPGSLQGYAVFLLKIPFVFLGKVLNLLLLSNYQHVINIHRNDTYSKFILFEQHSGICRANCEAKRIFLYCVHKFLPELSCCLTQSIDPLF